MDKEFAQAYQLLVGKIDKWVETAISLLPNLCIALIVMIFFFYLSRLIRSISKKLLEKISDHSEVSRLLSTIIYFISIVTGLFVTLSIVGLDKTVTSLLAGAGVIGLVLGFAFQELSANLISGIYIAFRRPFKNGDIIKVRDQIGFVKDINLRATVIKNFEGPDTYIPNKLLITEPVQNYTLDPLRRIDLAVGVSYQENLAEVEKTLLDSLKSIDGCDYPQRTQVFYRDFGDSSINLIVRFWIDYPGNDNIFRSTHDAIKTIKSVFDKKGITIPFPIRTLDIDLKELKKTLDKDS